MVACTYIIARVDPGIRSRNPCIPGIPIAIIMLLNISGIQGLINRQNIKIHQMNFAVVSITLAYAMHEAYLKCL